MASLIPASSRANARIDVLCALERLVPEALRQLHQWRSTCAASERSLAAYVRRQPRALAFLGHHAFSAQYAEFAFLALGWVLPSDRFDGVPTGVSDEAIDRVKAAVLEWTAAWHLEALWVRRWAFFARVRWDVARACDDPACPWRCADVYDAAAAIELVVGEPVLLGVVEEQYPEPLARTVENLALLDAVDPHRPRAPWAPTVISVLVDPAGGADAEAAAMARFRAATRAQRQALTAQGVSLREKWELERDAAWLVRYQVQRHELPAIAREAGVSANRVWQAVRRLAAVIDLPLDDRVARSTASRSAPRRAVPSPSER